MSLTTRAESRSQVRNRLSATTLVRIFGSTPTRDSFIAEARLNTGHFGKGRSPAFEEHTGSTQTVRLLKP
ncbi:hypothetical protein HNI00_19405 [Thermoleptolyngbya oregonensis NK1-22]|uniref:Uncharacterized protein n=1 Tax=Thermoleptolyngbya oregonensis NK1-22 TaxID=2547457 RepID=A0AA97BE02_9CYAN|nr:hypothetical protein [Thermoleptolyngbya oregonensis]WOB45069.1 hypothetical protein HNI00_19405 [Thermoleptolyngbya oregonensis NK1-22]